MRYRLLSLLAIATLAMGGLVLPASSVSQGIPLGVSAAERPDHDCPVDCVWL